MRLMMYSAIVVLLLSNNYSYAANKCVDLFQTRTTKSSQRSTLSLKKSNIHSEAKPYLKDYSKEDVEFLSQNINILKDFEAREDERSPHMSMIKYLERQAEGDFSVIIEKAEIVVEYMIDNNFLRDTADKGRNPKDAILSSYIKALYYLALNTLKDGSQGRSAKVSVRWEKRFLNDWANFRAHLYDSVARKYGTVIYKGNIVHFLFENLKDVQVKMDMPTVEHEIRLATIRDISRAQKLIGVHLSALKLIGSTSYRLNHVFKVDETLEALSHIVERRDRAYTSNLTFGERKMLTNVFRGLVNLFHRKSPSARSIVIMDEMKEFTDRLMKQRAYTTSEQEAFKVDKDSLFKLNVEAFVEQVDQLKLNKQQISNLTVEYVKHKGSLTEEEYFLLNELNLSYKAIDELEAYYSPLKGL